MISDGLWKRRYGGDRAILGRTILMSDNRYEVIGVMPPGFVFRDREIDYWTPIDLAPAVAADHNSHFLNVVARLAPGVSLAAASDDMQRVAKELERQFPNSNTNIGAVVVPVKDDALGNTRVELLVLMGAAAAVLLIACANLASLLLSRAVGRRGELAVRAALGATRGRLVRQLVIEAALVALAGGAIGLALAPAGTARDGAADAARLRGAAGVGARSAAARIHAGAVAGDGGRVQHRAGAAGVARVAAGRAAAERALGGRRTRTR